MKKFVSFLCAVLLCVCLCSGCVYRDPNEERGQGNEQVLDGVVLNPDKDYTGTLKIAAPDVQSHKTALNAFIESFNKKYPGIKITPVYLDLDSYKTKIGNAASSAYTMKDPTIMYDVFWLDQTYVNEWVQETDILSPLTPLIEKDESFDLDGINKKMTDMGSLNGKLYMMPRDYNQVVMYYNKAMFDAVKEPYPTDEMSGEEFVAMCRRLAQKLGSSSARNEYNIPYSQAVQYIVDCNVAWSSLDYPLVRSFGGEVINDKGEVVFESDESLAAISYWRDLVYGETNGVKLAIDLATGANSSGNQFRMQNSPIFLHARATMSDIINPVTIAGQEYKGVSELGVAALPKFGSTYAVGAGCSGYAMYVDCAHATEAYQFLKHVVSVEGQEAYSETGDCVPVLESLLTGINSKWRNCRPDKLDPYTFNHDAFIYKMDTATCSVFDFYPYIPLASQSYVTARIEEAFKTCIGGSKENMIWGLRAAVNAIKNDIATA